MQYFKPLAILCGCTARFVSDLVGNPEDRFSHNEAYFFCLILGLLGGSIILTALTFFCFNLRSCACLVIVLILTRNSDIANLFLYSGLDHSISVSISPLQVTVLLSEVIENCISYFLDLPPHSVSVSSMRLFPELVSLSDFVDRLYYYAP